MERYAPAYTVSDAIVLLSADITETIAGSPVLRSLESRPDICKTSLVRSIHASLAIEGSHLSLGNVEDILDGRKDVPAAENEVKDVESLYQAYKMIGSFDPYSLSDLQEISSVVSTGAFRSTSGAIYNRDVRIFKTPPPQEISSRLTALFDWMACSRDSVHPLVLSSVAHRELFRLYPFAEGNGCVARLWQKALLAEWKLLFKHAPLESEVFRGMDDYYTCFTVETVKFVEFILKRVKQALDWTEKQIPEQTVFQNGAIKKLLDVMAPGVQYTALQLMDMLGLKSRSSFLRRYIEPAVENGSIMMGIPNKPTSRNQTYLKT